MRKSASLNQQDNFGYTNNDGDLLSPSKRSFGGHVLSRGGSLASDITHLITGAMTRAALAWRAVSKAPAESEDLLVLSQDDRGVPSLRASTEMVRTRDSVFSGAQQQFHAVMQSAGLEPADQPTVQIPELTRRHSRGLPQAVQKEASTALQSTGLMANPVLEDTGATATLVLRAIQTAVESAFQGTLTTARSAVQKSNAAARDALQGPDDGAMPDRIATASALQGKASTASDVLEGTRAAVPCPDATSGLEPPAVHDYAGSIASSCQDPLVGQLHGSPSPHATATSQIRHGAPDSLSGSCSKEGSTCSSEDGGTSNSDARQKHEGSTSLDGTQFARESEDLDNGNDSNPRLAAVEACNAALRGNYNDLLVTTLQLCTVPSVAMPEMCIAHLLVTLLWGYKANSAVAQCDGVTEMLVLS